MGTMLEFVQLIDPSRSIVHRSVLDLPVYIFYVNLYTYFKSEIKNDVSSRAWAGKLPIPFLQHQQTNNNLLTFPIESELLRPGYQWSLEPLNSLSALSNQTCRFWERMWESSNATNCLLSQMKFFRSESLSHSQWHHITVETCLRRFCFNTVGSGDHGCLADRDDVQPKSLSELYSSKDVS